MVRNLEFNNDSKGRQKVFEGRAATLLKMASELATLCATPACVVIYNPDDVTRPWHIWPESEAELRSVIQIYKGKETGSGSMGPISNGRKGLMEEEAMRAEHIKSLVMNADRQIADVQKKIDTVIAKKTHHANHTTINVADPGLAAKEQDLAPVAFGDTEDGIAEQNAADNVVATSTTAAADIGAINFDGQLWDENELFDIDELLNLCEGAEDNDGHCLSSTIEQFQMDTTDAGETIAVVCEIPKDWEAKQPVEEGTCSSMSVAALAPAVGNKRKAPERVLSFSELMSPSLQRRKVEM